MWYVIHGFLSCILFTLYVWMWFFVRDSVPAAQIMCNFKSVHMCSWAAVKALHEKIWIKIQGPLQVIFVRYIDIERSCHFICWLCSHYKISNDLAQNHMYTCMHSVFMFISCERTFYTMFIQVECRIQLNRFSLHCCMMWFWQCVTLIIQFVREWKCEQWSLNLLSSSIQMS